LFGWWRSREIVIWSPLPPAEAAGSLQSSLEPGIWSPPRVGFVKLRGNVDFTGFTLVPSTYGIGVTSLVKLTGHFVPANGGGAHLVGRVASQTSMKISSLIPPLVLIGVTTPLLVQAVRAGLAGVALTFLIIWAVVVLITLLAQRQRTARFWLMHGLLRAHLTTVLRGVDVTPPEQSRVSR
jgi:hypothetical protein